MRAPSFDDCYRDISHVSLHCAFVYRRNTLIASATNTSERTFIRVSGIPVLARTVHAEMAALSQVRFNKNNKSQYTIVVVRYTRDGKRQNSKPCMQCESVISRLSQYYNITCRYSV